VPKSDIPMGSEFGSNQVCPVPGTLNIKIGADKEQSTSPDHKDSDQETADLIPHEVSGGYRN
jgi:hypothetical protein